MKQAKRPTRRQKVLIKQQKVGSKNLNPDRWLVRQISPTTLLMINKITGKIRKINDLDNYRYIW